MTNQEKAIRSELEHGHATLGFRVNYLVEAGAGAGKTHTMVQRMANQLVSGDCSPEHMVAITFTVKSTQEMKNRLDGELRDRKSKAATPEEAEQLEQLIRAAGQMQISTIHGFCQTLLESMPFQSPYGVEMNVMESDEALCRAFFKSRFWADPSRFDALRDRFGLYYKVLEDTFVNCCHNGEVATVYAPLTSPEYQSAVKERADRIIQLQEKLHEILKNIGSYWGFFDPKLAGLLQMTPAAFAADPDAQDALARLYRKTKGKLEVVGKDTAAQYFAHIISLRSPKAQAAANHPLTNIWLEARRIWEGKDKSSKQNPSHENELRIKYLKDAQAQVIHSLTMDALLPLVEDYRADKLARRIATYDDLLLRARDMLRDSADARSYFHNQYQVLFVDEFQDTDPVQAELLFYLTASPATANTQDWRTCRPEPGSLFLVGDPKQAIYRFRGADIDVYNTVKNTFSSGGGTICQLNTNFRSSDRLCGYTHQLFCPPAVLPPLGGPVDQPRFTRKLDAQGQPEPNYDPKQAEYAPMDAEQAGVPRSFAFYYGARQSQQFVPQTDRDGTPKVDAKGSPVMKNIGENQDPRQVAAFIRTMVDQKVEVPEKQKGGGIILRPARWGDFLILTRTKANIKNYAAALARLDIPTNVTGSQVLSEVGAIHRTLLHLKAMTQTQNDLALIRVLQECYQTKPAAIRLFLQRTGSSSLRSVLNRTKLDGIHAALAAEQPRDESLLALCAALEELLSLREMSARMPAMSVLAHLTDGGYGIWDTGGDMRTRRREYARMQQYLDLVRAGGQRSFPSLAAFAIDCAEQEVKYELALEEEPNQVRIMNLHQSKGLEGSIVILAHSSQGKNTALRHVDRQGAAKEYSCLYSSGGPTPSVLGWPHQWNGAQLPGRDSKKQEEEAYLEAEQLRLQYVAATRAAYWLVICGCAENWKYKDGQPELSVTSTGWSRIADPNVFPFLVDVYNKDSDPKFRAALKSLHTGECDYVQPGGGTAAFSSPQLLNEALALSAAACCQVGTYAITPSKLDSGRSGDRFQNKLGEDEASPAQSNTDLNSPDPESAVPGPRGKDWGTIVHRIMELAVRNGQYTPSALAEFAAQAVEETLPGGTMTANQRKLLLGEQQPDKPAAWLAEEAAKAANFLSRADSPLRALMENSRCYPELPFHISADDPDSDLYRHLSAHISDKKARGKPLDVQGILDLAIHRSDGSWIVVDYKTDALHPGETTEQLKVRLREEYTPQIMSYVKILERLNTGPVVGAYLCSIPLDGDLVPLLEKTSPAPPVQPAVSGPERYPLSLLHPTSRSYAPQLQRCTGAHNFSLWHKGRQIALPDRSGSHTEIKMCRRFAESVCLWVHMVCPGVMCTVDFTNAGTVVVMKRLLKALKQFLPADVWEELEFSWFPSDS